MTTAYCSGGRLVDEADILRERAREASSSAIHVRLPGDSVGYIDAVGDEAQNEVHKLVAVLAEQIELWAAQVAGGLRALHAGGRTHRNLNPGNVYLDAKRQAIVGSYQCLKCARGPGCKTSLGRADCGSHIVMSPELEDGGVVTTKADIWAFGCCLIAGLRANGLNRHPIESRMQRVPHAHSDRSQARHVARAEPKSEAMRKPFALTLAGEAHRPLERRVARGEGRTARFALARARCPPCLAEPTSNARLFPRSKAWNGARQRDGKLSEKVSFGSRFQCHRYRTSLKCLPEPKRLGRIARGAEHDDAVTQRGHVVAPRKSRWIRLERFQQAD